VVRYFQVAFIYLPLKVPSNGSCSLTIGSRFSSTYRFSWPRWSALAPPNPGSMLRAEPSEWENTKENMRESAAKVGESLSGMWSSMRRKVCGRNPNREETIFRSGTPKIDLFQLTCRSLRVYRIQSIQIRRGLFSHVRHTHHALANARRGQLICPSSITPTFH
jgi:hypothetical protein